MERIGLLSQSLSSSPNTSSNRDTAKTVTGSYLTNITVVLMKKKIMEKEELKMTKSKSLIEKIWWGGMGIKKFFWRKSAVVGIVWGLLSFTEFIAGGIMPLIRSGSGCHPQFTLYCPSHFMQLC
jgi:hypothetical protein